MTPSITRLLHSSSSTIFLRRLPQTIFLLPCFKQCRPLSFTSFSTNTQHSSYQEPMDFVNLITKGSDSSKRRNMELPEESSRNVMLLTYESSAEGGCCHVYMVGTQHGSQSFITVALQESCREVEVVIRHLKPQVVFLELCPSRLEIPTFGKLQVTSALEVVPGSEFCVAFEEARKYGGKVFLGDRPIEERGKQLPLLDDTVVHERDQFMSSKLLSLASKHNSVVAIVGKAHLEGVKKYWKQPVQIEGLMTTQKGTVSTTIVLIYLVFIAAGSAIGSYLASLI